MILAFDFHPIYAIFIGLIALLFVFFLWLIHDILVVSTKQDLALRSIFCQVHWKHRFRNYFVFVQLVNQEVNLFFVVKVVAKAWCARTQS